MNKTTRLSAVVLMLALCMNLFVSALATTEGIPLEDLDVSAYQRLLSETSAEDPLGIGGECGDENEYCGIILNTLSCMNALEIYEYLNVLYTKGLAEGEEAPSAEYTALMLHYGIKHLDMNIICTCGDHPLPLPDYQVGDISMHEVECPWHFANISTHDQYVILENADEEKKSELEMSLSAESAEKLSRVNVDSFTASSDNASVQISVPEEAFSEDYIITADEAVMNAAEECALVNAGISNVLASFDISFPSLEDESVELQPDEGVTVPLTFTVNVADAEGKALRVFHLIENEDGTITTEFVGDPIDVNTEIDVQTIEVSADSFSTWGVDLWDKVPEGNEDGEEVTLIGYLDKENYSEFTFFVDTYYVGGTSDDEKIVAAEDCPDYLILTLRFLDENGDAAFYMVDSTSDDFWSEVITYGYQFLNAEYFSDIVSPAGLYATIPDELSGGVNLYSSPDQNAAPVNVSAAEIAGEYVVEEVVGDSYWFIKLTPDNSWPVSTDYCWIDHYSLSNLSITPTKIVEFDDWNGDSATLALEYSFADAVSYQWSKTSDGENWTSIDGAVSGTLEINATIENMMCEYRCVAVDAAGNVLMQSNEVMLLPSEMVNWLRTKSTVVTDEIMSLAKKAIDKDIALDEAIGITAANELVWIFDAEILATIDEEGMVIDARYHIPVAQVNNGMIYPIEYDTPADETTDSENAA